VDADDTNPPLRNRVRRAMDHWRRIMAGVLRDAIAAGDLPAIDVEATSDALIATMEGGVMLAKLYGNAIHMHRAADHIANYIEVLGQRPVVAG
jgi:hypothetical protein